MHIVQILNSRKICFSFEFFPPKDRKASDQLFQTIGKLTPLEPSFVSVTYGAGGSTRELTHDLVVRIQKETSLTVVAHLTCVGSTREEILQALETYTASGIENLMLLRGDPPKGQERFTAPAGGFRYAAELVAFVREHFPHLGIGVAGFPHGHPETPNRLKEMDFLKVKVDAGADYVCTQLFFDNHVFYDYRERCELAGIRVPIVAGIMPITSLGGMKRMAELAAGTPFSAKLLRSLARAEGDAGVEKAGIHWATEQVRDLIDQGVKGIHFYTLNKSRATLKIYETLGVTSSAKLSQ